MYLCDQSRYKFYVTFSELDFCVNTATDQGVSVSVGNSEIAVDQSAGVRSTDLLKTQATITIVILE